MSANNQMVVAPFPQDLDKYAVWYDGCVDNPFNFSKTPQRTFDRFSDAMAYALDQNDGYIEYQPMVLMREHVVGYEMGHWGDFPDYQYLDAVLRSKKHPDDTSLHRRLSDVK